LQHCSSLHLYVRAVGLYAPWSNAYEAIVYVVGQPCFGLAFDIKSKLTVASCLYLAIILSAAYMNWIDPEIAIYRFLTLTG
jgi:hypothetical protein